MEVKVTVDLVNAVLNYLSTKPYSESAQLIQAIHSQVLPQINAAQQPPAPPDGNE